MSYGSYAFADLALEISFMVRLLTAILAGILAGWLVGYALLLTETKAVTAWHRRREQAAYRAEVARGLAEIDQFIRAHSGRITGSGCTDAEGTHDES